MSGSTEFATTSADPDSQAAHASGPSISPADGYASASVDGGFGLPPVDPSALATVYRQPLQRSVNASVRAVAFRRTQQTHGNRIAQRVAATGASIAPPLLQRKCACGGTCEECQADEDPGAEAEIPESAGAHDRAAQLMASSQAQPLDMSSRSTMEASFGRDLSDVRIHTDANAAGAAATLDAAAFTTGNDIYFSEARFAPGTDEGRHLLAHEVAHTIQQSDGVASLNASASTPFVVAPADHPLEAEADRAADRVSVGESGTNEPVATSSSTDLIAHRSPVEPGLVQREPDPNEEGGVLPARPVPGTTVEPAAPPDRSPVPVRPSGEFFYVGSYRTGYYAIANDREFLRYEMMRLVADKGLTDSLVWIMGLISRQGRSLEDAPRPFSAHTIADRRRVRSPLDAQRDMEADLVRQRVAPDAIPVAIEVYFEIYREAVIYLNGFEEKARGIANTVLNSSEQRANAERVRYGLQAEEILPADWTSDDFGQPNRPEAVYRYSMGQAGDSGSLTGAAKDLKAKRDAIDQLKAQRAKLYKIRGFFSPEVYLPEESQAESESLKKQAEQAQTEYDVLRSAYERRYPILARFAEDPAAIARIASGTGERTAQLLHEQVSQTLSNIAKVRRELTTGGRVKIWKLPEIVQLTKVATQATGDSLLARMRSKVVDDKKKQVEDEEFWRHLALGALALGLALLAAIPTGGSSLLAGVAAIAALGSLGLSVTLASESLQDYNLEKAMTGTDFDRAQAISNEDPSLFWLAVDIVGIALDVGPALKATRTAMTSARQTFRTLAPLARRALSAQGPEVAESLAALRRAANTEELGAAVVRSAERLRGAANAEQAIGRAAGHEAAARAAATTDSLGSAASTALGGHTVRVAPGSGALVICSSCTWVRGLFATELGQNAKLLERLEKLEESARAAAAAGDAAAGTRIAEQARQLADELTTLRRARLTATTRVLSAVELDQLRRLRSLDPTRMTQQEIEALQGLREASGEAFQGRLVANTADHKAERWLEYRSRGGDWPYSRWSPNYHQNMVKALESHKLVDAHRVRLGWGETQVVTRPFGESGARRVLDIAEEVVDPLTGQRTVLRAVEHKEGYITMSDAIRAEIDADRALSRQGAAIEWYIEGRASQGLRDALEGPPRIPLHETKPNVPIAEIRGGSSAE